MLRADEMDAEKVEGWMDRREEKWAVDAPRVQLGRFLSA
jgi:hypothetical protein